MEEVRHHSQLGRCQMKDRVRIETPKVSLELWRPNIEDLLKGGNTMDCNKKIAEYVESHGITQKFLCDKTGITPEKISNILNNKRKITGDELINLCNVLGLNLDYFKD